MHNGDSLILSNTIPAQGQASTKQKAKQEAARALLDSISHSGRAVAATAIDQKNNDQ